jgi:hypothetical protein
MRNHVSNTLMVGLGLLLGCNQVPQYTCTGPRYYSGREVASVPSVPANSPPAQPTQAGAPGMLPQPIPSGKEMLPTRPSPTGPEVSNMRVYARQGPAAPSTNVIPAETPVPAVAQPAPANVPSNSGSGQALPEVVLLGVGGGSTQGKPTAPETRTVAAGSKSEAAFLAPELNQAAPEPSSLPAQQPGNAGFAHAADYGWLTGELEHIQAKNVWRLRYAPADQEDRYGGAVQLVGDSLPPGCKSGQVVRVEGQIVNPDAGPRPPYWVRSFQLLKEASPDEE